MLVFRNPPGVGSGQVTLPPRLAHVPLLAVPSRQEDRLLLVVLKSPVLLQAKGHGYYGQCPEPCV